MSCPQSALLCLERACACPCVLCGAVLYVLYMARDEAAQPAFTDNFFFECQFRTRRNVKKYVYVCRHTRFFGCGARCSARQRPSKAGGAGLLTV